MKKLIYLTIFIFAILISTNNTAISNVNSYNSDSTEYCIVGGEKIEGEGIKYNYLNREIKFCCEGCEMSFKKNPAKFLKSSELRCPVCNEDDAKKNMSLNSGGVKYYFCSKSCKTKFSNEPETYLKNYQK